MFQDFQFALSQGKKKEAMELLANLHGHTAGYKAITTWMTSPFGETAK